MPLPQPYEPLDLDKTDLSIVHRSESAGMHTNSMYRILGNYAAAGNKENVEMSRPFGYIDLNSILPITGPQHTALVFRNMISITRLKAGLSCAAKEVVRYTADAETAVSDCILWLNEHGYITFRMSGDWCALRDTTGEYIDARVLINGGNDRITAYIYGDLKCTEEFQAWLQSRFAQEGTIIKVATGIPEKRTLDIDEFYVPSSSEEMGRPSFYPWINVPLETYFKEFMASSESVLVLFGPPGTGKSTLLRSLIHSGNYTSILAYNREVVESPLLVDTFYNDNKARILAYEDIDNHLKSRDDGNLLMSTFLNASEGVIQHPGKKIVLSTNLATIDKIDPALLRVGRCFDILQFHELDESQAHQVLKDVGREPKDFSTKPKWTLAEVLNKENTVRQRVNRFANRVGFV